MEPRKESVTARFKLPIECERFAEKLERRPIFILSIMVLCYAMLLIMPVQRRLWHDELFTYYIAQAPDIHTLIYEIRHLDLNPPMVYAVTRGWQNLFGVNEVVTRIPSAVAYLLASLGFILFLRRRAGLLWACASISLFWASPNFLYATELRPYALLLLFFALTLVSWDSVQSRKYRRFALAGLFAGAAGMMMCHVFAIFPLGAVYFGELLRSVRRRQIDRNVCICLLLPLAIIATYVTSSQSFEASAFPQRFQGGFRKMAVYLTKTSIGIAVPFGVALIGACLATRPRIQGLTSRFRNVRAEDAGLWFGLMAIPVLMNLVLMHMHGAFFERYCLSTSLAVAVTVVMLLGAITEFSSLAALCAGVVILTITLHANLVQPLLRSHHRQPAFVTDQIHSKLPFVAASGLTFLEMDHYEKSEFLSRVYYLTDRPSALRYAHATIFEGMGNLARYFPFRAKVSRYNDFIGTHRKFLVLGTKDFPEDWLLRKLIAEGALMRQIGTLKSLSYKDETVYEVTLPEGPTNPPTTTTAL